MRNAWNDLQFLADCEAVATLQHITEQADRIRQSASPQNPPNGPGDNRTVARLPLRPGPDDANRTWRIVE